jgi:hypothetical protein
MIVPSRGNCDESQLQSFSYQMWFHRKSLKSPWNMETGQEWSNAVAWPPSLPLDVCRFRGGR